MARHPEIPEPSGIYLNMLRQFNKDVDALSYISLLYTVQVEGHNFIIHKPAMHARRGHADCG